MKNATAREAKSVKERRALVRGRSLTAPCDSSENRMLFDGRLGPGRYRWDIGATNVCYQHTSRALPDSDWSESRVIGTTRIRPHATAEIVVSTE